MKMKLIYDGPIPAPIKRGTEVGKVVVSLPGQADLSIPVLAGADVEQLGLFGRLWSAVSTILLGEAGS